MNVQDTVFHKWLAKGSGKLAQIKRRAAFRNLEDAFYNTHFAQTADDFRRLRESPVSARGLRQRQMGHKSGRTSAAHSAAAR
jgi:hypothetical protein